MSGTSDSSGGALAEWIARRMRERDEAVYAAILRMGGGSRRLRGGAA